MHFDPGTIYRQSLVGILLCVAIVLLANFFLKLLLWSGLGLVVALVYTTLVIVFSERKAANPVVLLLLYSIITVCWVLYFDSHQVSDFGVYFRCGTEFASPWTSLSDWSSRCESAWLPGFATYWRRSLLYSLPIGWLADHSYLGFKVANALLHIATVVLLYRGVSTAFGQSAGLFSAALLAIYPEFWFVTTVVSSDNLAVLILVGFIFALAKLSKDGGGVKINLLLVVVLLIALDLLRSVGPILIVAILLALPLSPKGARANLFKAAIWSSITVFGIGLVPALFGMTTRQTNGLLATLVGSGLTHGRLFEESYSWHQYVLPLIDVDHRTNLLAGLIAQDLTSAFSMPSFWLQKIYSLFGGEGYYFFAAARPLGSPDDFVLTHTQPALVFTQEGAAAMRGMVVFCCAAAGLGALKVFKHPLGYVSVTVGSAFLLYIILIGEVQARYSLLIAPALCIASAGVVTMRASDIFESFSMGTRGVLIVSGGLLATMLIAKAWAHSYVAQAPSLVWSNGIEGYPSCDAAHNLDIESRRITLALPSKGCYALGATAKNISGDIVFYVMRAPVPPRWSRKLHHEIDITIVARHGNGAVQRMRTNLSPEEVVKPIKISSENLISLELLIQANVMTTGGLALSYFHDEQRVVANARQN